jgi:hypothetical protein
MKKNKFHLDRGDLDKLCQYIDQRSLMIEIGSLAGISTEIFSKYFKKVVSIDPYIGGYDEKDINSRQSRLDEAKSIFIEKFKNNPSVTQFNITSDQAAYTYPDDKSIDLVYIDACHTYESVLRDINTWKNKTKYIAGHDWDWEGVRSAVLESFSHKNILNFKPNHWLVCNEL